MLFTPSTFCLLSSRLRFNAFTSSHVSLFSDTGRLPARVQAPTRHRLATPLSLDRSLFPLAFRWEERDVSRDLALAPLRARCRWIRILTGRIPHRQSSNTRSQCRDAPYPTGLPLAAPSPFPSLQVYTGWHSRVARGVWIVYGTTADGGFSCTASCLTFSRHIRHVVLSLALLFACLPVAARPLRDDGAGTPARPDLLHPAVTRSSRYPLRRPSPPRAVLLKDCRPQLRQRSPPSRPRSPRRPQPQTYQHEKTGKPLTESDSGIQRGGGGRRARPCPRIGR
ncbi:hypothetical protein B0H11DRAFT_1332646 [Mycena galericulata]|nr:hypothetical protein B0H11DRAFT_1332646 [Mycena galericulata]